MRLNNYVQLKTGLATATMLFKGPSHIDNRLGLLISLLLFGLFLPVLSLAQTPICANTLSVSAGPCYNNTYTLTGVINFTNAPASSLTIIDGSVTATVNVPENATSVSFSLAGIQAGSGDHVVTVFSSATACNTLGTTYTSPSSCAINPCSLSLSVTPSICSTITNMYSLTGVLSANDVASPPLSVTISTGTRTVVQSLTANNNTFTFVLNNLPSDGQVKTVTVLTSSTACNNLSETYNAPASCSVAVPCSVSISASPTICNSVNNSYSLNGLVSVGNGPSSGTLTVSTGSLSITYPISPTIGTYGFTFEGLTSNGQTGIVTATFTGTSCGPVSQTYLAPASCTVAMPCSKTLTLNPTACNSATNSYTLAGTLNVANGPASGTIIITTAGVNISFVVASTNGNYNFHFDDLPANSASGTVSVSFSGTTCTPISQTYLAPASCSVAVPCSVSLALSPGNCSPANNLYSLTGTLTAINVTPPITVTVSGAGFNTFVQSLTSVNNTFNFTINGLLSDGLTKTITVATSATACAGVSNTYTAPTACTQAVPCSVSLTVAPTACNPATNTFTLTGSVVVANGPSSGTLTVALGSLSATFPVSQTVGTYNFNFTSLSSNGLTGTVTATFSGTSCGPVSRTFNAPVSCSTAVPCSVSLALTPGVCNSATNAYALQATLTANNITAPLTVTITGAGAPIVQSLTAISNTFNFTVNGLSSDGLTKTITVATSATACAGVSNTYTAPAACTQTVPCSVSLTVAPTACNPATNTFTLTGSVVVANGPSSGTLTVALGSLSATFPVSQTVGTYNFNFTSLSSNGLTGTVTATFSGTSCGPVSRTFNAPVSCSTAVPCSVSLALTPGVCNSATNAYALQATLTANNITAPLTVTITGAGAPIVQSLTAISNTFNFTVNGLSSDGLTKTITVATSATACAGVSNTYTAPAACTQTVPNPACSLSVTTGQPICSVATANQYSLTGLITVINGPANQTLVVTDGLRSTTLTITGSGSTSFVLSNLTSDGATHTVSVVSSGTTCGSTSKSYTAPANCLGPCPQLSLLLLSNSQICNGQCASFSISTDASATIELVRFTAPQTGTAVYSGGVVMGEGTPVNGVLVIPQGIPGVSLPQNTGTSPVTYYIYARLKTPAADPNCRPFGEAQVSVLPAPQYSLTSLPACASSQTRNVLINISSAGSYDVFFAASVGAISCGLASPTGTVASFTVTGGATFTATLPSSFSGVVLIRNLATDCQAFGAITPVTLLPAPTFTAVATPVSCSGLIAVTDASITLTNLVNAATYQYSTGSVFTTSGAIPATPATVPGNGIIASGLSNPASLTGQPYTIRVASPNGCTTDQTITLTRKDCACPPAECVPVTSVRIR